MCVCPDAYLSLYFLRVLFDLPYLSAVQKPWLLEIHLSSARESARQTMPSRGLCPNATGAGCQAPPLLKKNSSDARSQEALPMCNLQYRFSTELPFPGQSWELAYPLCNRKGNKIDFDLASLSSSNIVQAISNLPLETKRV